MKAAARLLGALLAWGILSLWVDERWPWAVFQLGVFALAGWRAFGARFAIRPALVALGAAAAWPLVQLAFGTTIYRQATWMAALDWGTFFLVFALSQDLLGEVEARREFLSAASVFGMAVAAAASVGLYVCPGSIGCVVESGFQNEVMGPFVNRNQYSAWVELLLPAALYLAATNRRLRALFAAAAVVMIASVAASGSRAGMALVAMAVVAAALALAAGHRMDRRRLAWGAAQVVAWAALAVALVGWQESLARWRDGGSEALRQDAVRASYRMVADRPWMGSGLGTWSRVYPRYATIDQGVFVNQAHNDWAQWAAEGGLPFFLFLLFFAGLLWKPAIQSIYGLGMVAFLLHALVDYPMEQRPALAAWFFAMAGVVCAWRAKEFQP